MAARDPETRVQSARAAAMTRWGRTGSHEERLKATQAARDAGMARWEREADPDGKLTPAERARAAESLRQAHMIRMSLKAARLKRERTKRQRARNAGEDGKGAAA